MASFLSSLITGDKKPAYDFHNDQSLHDDTTEDARPTFSNLGGDALAIIKNIDVFRKQGREQGFKAVASELDLEDPLSKFISKNLVSMLWGSLLHPPPSYRGLEYRYRMADGSNNSVLYPHLGKAGLPYARTVPAQRAMHGARPDPGDLFDLLMARKDEGIESKSGISMMLLYHATTIIHDIFRTDDYDTNASKTSSYLDLAPLYGSDLETQQSVRQMKDGLLKPDTFAEKRLLNQPPGVCIYIIMYNRFHNYVAKQLKEVNEHGRFSLPPKFETLSKEQQVEALKQQDEHLFQTARLVTCGMYINIAVHDYLRCLMGVHELDTPWTLDPRKALPEKNDRKGLDRGEGNMVSVEFNLLYRFHSPISKRDADWSEEAFIGAIKGAGRWIPDDIAATPAGKAAIDKGEKFTTEMIKNGDVPVQQFMDMLSKLRQYEQGKTADKDLPYFPAGLDRVGATPRGFRFTRDPKTGLFDDAQLAAEMTRAIEDPICQFGAQNIPKVFRSIEVMGILQARKWEVATLNEFREFFGMSRFKSFEEINADKDIQDKLRDLYEDPDLVELYPGLFCEGQGRNLDPGISLPEKASSSLWRGVFSDAVTLVRSDRFYTLDWNVASLTSWGMNEVTSNPKVNKGSVMHRLFERAFPGCFNYNSIHMWQPFYTPTRNILIAHRQGYLSFLNMAGLVDKDNQPLVFTRSENQIFINDKPYTQWKDTLEESLARRRLSVRCEELRAQDPAFRWRGNETVTTRGEPKEVTSFKTIKEQILGGEDSKNWVSPVSVEPTDIPEGPLRDIMTKDFKDLEGAMDTINKSLPEGWTETFMDYFVGLAQDIRLREQRPFQKRTVKEQGKDVEVQSYQLDVVKDLAIPVVTRFFADLVGFWDQVKTPEFPERKFNENQIYQHIENCHELETCDADPTKAWKRRMAFQESIKVLKQLAEDGVYKSQHGWFEDIVYRRKYGSQRDGQHVQDVRKIGVAMVQALSKKLTTDCVAAVMLYTALDMAQRFVLMFSESLAWFIDPTTREDRDISTNNEQTKRWQQFKSIAWDDTVRSNKHFDMTSKPRHGKNEKRITEQLEQYVLEVCRISNPIDISRVYRPADKNVKETKVVVKKSTNSCQPACPETITRGQTVLLNLREAYSDHESGLKDPDCFRLRCLDEYIGFGPTLSSTTPGETTPPRFGKRVALIGLTGLLKHCAHLQEIRVAHDKSGRLLRITTPQGYHRYASPKMDRLLPFPSTWNVRYSGIGECVFDGKDNADQGHGQNVLWHYESLGNEVNGRVEAERKRKVAEEDAINKRIDEAVRKAVAEALGKQQQQQQPKVAGELSKHRSQVQVTELAADVE